MDDSPGTCCCINKKRESQYHREVKAGGRRGDVGWKSGWTHIMGGPELWAGGSDWTQFAGGVQGGPRKI